MLIGISYRRLLSDPCILSVWLSPSHLKGCPPLPCLGLNTHHCFTHRLLKLSVPSSKRYKTILTWACPLTAEMVDDSCSPFVWCSLRIWLPDGWLANYWVYDSSFSKVLSLPIIFFPLGKPLHHLCRSPAWEALAEVVPLYQAEEQFSAAAPFFWKSTGMAVEHNKKGNKVEMQVAVAFDAGEISLSQAVSAGQPVNLSYSSCLTCWLYRSIWGGFEELFFSSLWNLLISLHELFLLVQARKIRRIISGICAIQLPWWCLRDYKGINVVHLEVKTETTEPWTLTSVPLLIPLLLTILC